MKIYTAGKMSELTYREQMGWRNNVEKLLIDSSDEDLKFIHPPLYYSYEDPLHISEQEVMNWDLQHLRDCEIMIVNLDRIEESIGTIYEIATANILNQTGHKFIYIIGFGHTDKPLHPWIELSLHRKEATLENVVEYILNFLTV